MKAIILSAGKGTRLNEKTRFLPKPMIPIQGKPLLQRHIEHLKKFGIHDFYINLYYLPEKIRNYFGDGKTFGVNIAYLPERTLQGTAGALRPLSNEQDVFLVLFGDVLTTINIKDLYAFHKKNKSLITVVTRKTDHPEDSDLILVKNDRMTNLHLKPHHHIPKSRLALTGIYVLDSSVFRYLPKMIPSDISRDFLPMVLAQQIPIFCYNTFDLIMDIGTLGRLKKAEGLTFP